MKRQGISRRDLLQGPAALALATVFASPARAETPPPEAITPQLIEAAKKEGTVVLYSSMDLPVGEKLAKAFEAHYPGIAVQVERSGSERLFQRVAQEFSSNIRAADVINSSDASHFISWKKNGWLAPFVTEDIAQHFLPEFRDPDGMSAECIMLAPRPDGIPFLSDDRRLLQSLAGALAVVRENVRFRVELRKQEERQQQLRWLASRAELKALRAQINPHFLFNSLSVIAGLVHYQPEKADDAIEQLAEVFRYTLRNSEHEWARWARRSISSRRTCASNRHVSATGSTWSSTWIRRPRVC